MNKKNRSKIAIVNSTVTLLSQVIQIVIGFFLRRLFITSLGVEYLGYNSVFSNILQMLNLADLGIGVAVTSFLYAPLAYRENDNISALMYLYKVLYRIVGVLILIIGFAVSFFINYLIPDAVHSLSYLRVLFLINLTGTASSYFLAYSRTLLIADQKSHYTNIIDTLVFTLISGLQTLSLIRLRNYTIYLVLNIAKNIISNVVIAFLYNKEYRDILTKPSFEIVNNYRVKIFEYLKDVFVSRIGAVILYGTDNVIISTIKGSLLTGLLSNYTLITTQITTIINQIVLSLQSTYGNYINSEPSIDNQKKMTCNYLCANYIIGNFCMVCFMLLAQPFIQTLYGESLLLGSSTVVWLGINLLLSTLIQLPSQVFTIYRLFKYDRPIIIVSALLNITMSMFLVNKLGVDGTLIGTFATLIIYLFSRFYIISKYIFHISFLYFVKKIILYFACSTISVLVSYFITMNILVSNWQGFLIKGVCVFFVALLTTCTLICWENEFKFIFNKIVPDRIKRIIHPSSLVIITILFSVCVIFLSLHYNH